MRKNILGRVIGSAAAICCLAVSLVGCGSADSSSAGDQASSGGSASGRVLTENATGKEGDYSFELWKDKGDTTMTLGEGGNFSCEWSKINNALFRRGLKYNSSQTYKELGDISVDYGADYQPDGNSYLCVYGWTRDPLIEFYVVESWGSWRPPGASAALGTVEVDGGVYDIYRTTRYNQPSIDGTKTFDQFWSVRKTKPQTIDGTKIEGTISVTKHFQAWEKVGLELGKMYEVALTVEGYQSSGKAEIYKNEFKVSGSYTEAEDIEVTADETAAGVGFFTEDFESGSGSWQPRGDGVSISVNKEKSNGGSASLYVTGRGDTWHGTQIPLDNKIFKPGKEYNFKADVMQESGKAADLKLTMQYNANGTTGYDGICDKSAESGEWVTLENNYTIPEGASGLVLYVETKAGLDDLYIDNVSAGAAEGSTVEDDEDEEDSQPAAVTPAVDTSWIDPDKPMVAISFDDGASATKKGDPAYRIIDAVADAGFHATFFYVGNWIKTEEQVKYAYEKGMEIANHTTTHPYLSKCDAEKIRSEFDTTDAKLKSIIGAEPSKLMRLPYLDSNSLVTETLNDVPLISCSIDTQDWNKRTTEQIVDTLKKAKENGSLENAIVLCHENYATTAEAMEQIIPWLKDEGWQVVTISEMFAVKGKTLQGGRIYKKLV